MPEGGVSVGETLTEEGAERLDERRRDAQQSGEKMGGCGDFFKHASNERQTQEEPTSWKERALVEKQRDTTSRSTQHGHASLGRLKTTTMILRVPCHGSMHI